MYAGSAWEWFADETPEVVGIEECVGFGVDLTAVVDMVWVWYCDCSWWKKASNSACISRAIRMCGDDATKVVTTMVSSVYEVARPSSLLTTELFHSGFRFWSRGETTRRSSRSAQESQSLNRIGSSVCQAESESMQYGLEQKGKSVSGSVK